jgi:NAD(P)-dependent dehydrogenase (short-subunit alcohol dehydrogenase family)
MARILVTGSSDGIGLAAARDLIARGHAVTVHARSAARARQVRGAWNGAEAVLTGDFASLAETAALAGRANELGQYDAVLHNAGIGSSEPRVMTADGIEHVLAVNAIAPYLLTSLMAAPGRLVYVTSGAHLAGIPRLDDLGWTSRPWDPLQAYRDSKLLETAMALAVARLWPDALVNTVSPGWVPTKMANHHAPDDLALGHVTQVWLAVSDDPKALVTGGYFFHEQPEDTHPAARDPAFQDEVMKAFESMTGVRLPSL